MDKKLDQLKEWFKNKDSVLVAFSGGVDSALLLKAAQDVLGSRVLAVTADSPLNTPEEKESAVNLAKHLEAEHVIFELNDLDNPLVRKNPEDRCYHCKKARFQAMLNLAKERNIAVVVEGSNVDDLKDYRPGLKAVQELGIASPLEEVGLNKNEIRKLARELGLEVWNKPSEPCLATRIPFHTELTAAKLARVMAAEKYLKQELSLNVVRVRDHNGLARIEVDENSFTKIIELKNSIHEMLVAQLGFKYTALDLFGYRTGSMNQFGG
ncbi:MAG: ATP-dependent sacrificial sulfur transferase LarE [Peptococcaceae bacterium]